MPSIAVLAAMGGIALLTSHLSGVDGSGLFLAYFFPALCVALAAIPVWAGVELLRFMIRRERQPGAELWRRWCSASPMLVLPVLVQPLFLSAFTTAKTAIVPLVSFNWDERFAQFDRMIFGVDPWRITFEILGVGASRALEFLYTAGWGLSFAFIQVFVALTASRRFAVRFFLAMNLSWMAGGIVLAYLMPAAGPVFAHLFEPALAGRFDELRHVLGTHLLSDGAVLRTQAYLVATVGTHHAELGGGISAMPSIHVEVAVLYILAARHTRWSIPAIVFTLLTFIGSVHFGYHYAVDGLVSLAVVVVCWKFAGLRFDNRSASYPLPMAAPAYRFARFRSGPPDTEAAT